MSEPVSPCPVCATRQWREVRRERDYFRPQSAATYSLAECGRCGLVLQLPPPRAAELQAAYDILDWPSFRGDWKTRAWSGVKLLRRITIFRRMWRLRRHARGRALLEVGCGAGDFLLAAHQSGRHVCGVEYRDDLAAALREGLGLDVRSGALQPGLWPDDSFDAIAYWEVLEHVPDAAAELSLAARYLRPGGALLLSFPTITAVHQGKEFGVCWAPLELPRHLVFFNRATFARLCAKAGLRLVRYETPLLDALWCFFTSAWRQARGCSGRGRRAWHFLRLVLRIGLFSPALALRCGSGSGPQAIAIAVKDPQQPREWNAGRTCRTSGTFSGRQRSGADRFEEEQPALPSL
jgi:SAM-dependent methyltransferase